MSLLAYQAINFLEILSSILTVNDVRHLSASTRIVIVKDTPCILILHLKFPLGYNRDLIKIFGTILSTLDDI